MSKKCNECYFNEVCPSRRICKHFTPIVDELTNEQAYEIIDSARQEYYAEWLEYIDDEDYFFV